jgi:hypothetical protein
MTASSMWQRTERTRDVFGLTASQKLSGALNQVGNAERETLRHERPRVLDGIGVVF